MPDPAPSSILVEQRFLGSLFLAVDRGDLAAFLAETSPIAPGPLARWMTSPAHRQVAAIIDDLLSDGSSPDAMTVAGRLMDTRPDPQASTSRQAVELHAAAETVAVGCISDGTAIPGAIRSDAQRLRDSHDRTELIESLRWTATEAKRGESLTTLRELLAERLAATARPTIDAFGSTSAAHLIENHPQMRPPLIEGLLRLGEVMNLVAAPKVGKSWLGLGLALSVATGVAWLGMETHQKRVLYIDNELHHETWATRAHMVAAQMHAQDGLHAIYPVLLRGQVKSLPDMESSICEAAGRHACGLIILDALYRMLPQDASENDNSAMTQLFNCLDRIASSTGCCVVVVHHSSKGNQGEKANTDVGAGAGALARATDCHLTMRPHEEDELISVNVDVRSFPKVAPFVITRNKGVVWTVKEDADPERVKGRKQGPGSSGPPITAESFLATFLPQRPASIEEIMESARGAGLALSRGRIKGMLEHAVTEGKAVCVTGKNGAALYGREADPDSAGTYDRVKKYLIEHPQAGDREIARVLSCSHTSVGRARKAISMEKQS